LQDHNQAAEEDGNHTEEAETLGPIEESGPELLSLDITKTVILKLP
jgi:hypothetical protein